MIRRFEVRLADVVSFDDISLSKHVSVETAKRVAAEVNSENGVSDHTYTNALHAYVLDRKLARKIKRRRWWIGAK